MPLKLTHANDLSLLTICKAVLGIYDNKVLKRVPAPY